MNSVFENIVAEMSKPQFYPNCPESIEVIQTHISVIFIAGDSVYKLKKPMNLGFLDFTTLEKRRHYCRQEVALNSRFSENIYQGVVSIYLRDGVLGLQGPGEEVEIAVLMRKIPHDRIMINMLRKGVITPEMLEQLADRIVFFHSRAESSPEISSYGSLPVIYQNLRENFQQTEAFVGRTLHVRTHREIARLSYNFMESHSDLLAQRSSNGFIRDCHGDLHLDHVVFLDKIMLFDCIEFNDRFRFGDTASDLSFLLMDLDYKAYPGFAQRVEKRYVEASGDGDMERLLPFYKSYRAFVRGKVHSFAIDEPEISSRDREVHAANAADYFKLSLACLKQAPPPALIITVGLTGAGKSYLAERLGNRLGVAPIRSDVVRKQSHGISLDEHRLDNYQAGIYTPNTTERTYDCMLRHAGEQLSSGKTAIIDASFLKLNHRLRAAELASSHKALFVILQCTAPVHLIRRRLETRMKEGKDPSDGRWEIYQGQLRAFDPICDQETRNLHVWNSEENPSDFLDALVKEVMFSQISGEELHS